MREILKERRLIWKLAKNDFKKRYAGSYMGVLWALIQPVITVVLYYFVFEVVFKNRAALLASGISAPYVLYLTAGLVPWFYFSEAIMQGVYALLEYNYLVKKVVFKIEILPVIKVIGASFIHLFFVGVLIIMYFVYGQIPTWKILQIPYYSFCLFALLVAAAYVTSSVVVFFRDLAQIINISLQVLMWATPIMWDLAQLGTGHPILCRIFKLNPLYYIVSGYRDSLFSGGWFWQSPILTLYFWVFTIALFLFGRWVFRRLKPHFADVL